MKNWKIYNILLNMYRFRHCFKNIGKEFGFFDMLKLSFYNLINKRNKIIFLKKLNIFVKPNFFIITTLIEIFDHKLYQPLKNMDCVLDLGAYIGESSIYLARHNRRVVSFEPSKEKFKLLEKNIKPYQNIIGFNYAVVEDENLKTLTFHQRDEFDFCSSSSCQRKLNKQTVVKCKDIYSVLDQYTCDGIKMDIEGGEYSIINGLVKNSRFDFKKGIIEFHFSGENKDKFNFFLDFYNYLINKDYLVTVFDNYNKEIKNIENNKTISCLNLNFSKNETE